MGDCVPETASPIHPLRDCVPETASLLYLPPRGNVQPTHCAARQRSTIKTCEASPASADATAIQPPAVAPPMPAVVPPFSCRVMLVAGSPPHVAYSCPTQSRTATECTSHPPPPNRSQTTPPRASGTLFSLKNPHRMCNYDLRKSNRRREERPHDDKPDEPRQPRTTVAKRAISFEKSRVVDKQHALMKRSSNIQAHNNLINVEETKSRSSPKR